MINKVTLVGNLGADPELAYIPSGKAVVEFRLATTSGFGDKQETEWHRVKAWDKTAEACGKFLKKGSKVYVEGRIKSRQYNDKDGNPKYVTEIIAYEVKFLDGKPAKPDQDPNNGAEADAWTL